MPAVFDYHGRGLEDGRVRLPRVETTGAGSDKRRVVVVSAGVEPSFAKRLQNRIRRRNRLVHEDLESWRSQDDALRGVVENPGPDSHPDIRIARARRSRIRPDDEGPDLVVLGMLLEQCSHRPLTKKIHHHEPAGIHDLVVIPHPPDEFLLPILYVVNADFEIAGKTECVLHLGHREGPLLVHDHPEIGYARY